MKKGFTIIELIVVIAIIAILAAIVMVNVTKYINQSKDAAIQADLKAIQTNAIAWIANHNGVIDGFFNDNEFLAAQAIANAGGNQGIGGGLSSDSTKFCFQTYLASNHNIVYCTDSSGFFGQGICGAITGICTAQ